MGPKPTSEFRQELVRVALTSGLGRKQVASDFGVGFSTLRRWIKEGPGSGSDEAYRVDKHNDHQGVIE
jgi:transposase-like protein